MSALSILTPPTFCQYVNGPCDQTFDGDSQGPLFLYPSSPEPIAVTIENAIISLRSLLGQPTTRGWKQLPVSGQLIFCEICKAMRYASTVLVDTTTLNFNLMFELGFAIGLGAPVIPIRDTTYARDHREFDELGLLDTLGYLEFTNSQDLVEKLSTRLPGAALPAHGQKLFQEPLYLLKDRITTEGTLRLYAHLKKSKLRYRAYDPAEQHRLSLAEVRRQVAGSRAIVAHLMSPERVGSQVHNAQRAFVAGLAVAEQKCVLLLQEEHVTQPIDYRDIVHSYTNPNDIEIHLEPLILQVVENMQSDGPGRSPLPQQPLEQLDLGDIAAENEVLGLRSYFIRTGQYTQARQGHARLVVGRKGSGKTAIFYAVRDSFRIGPQTLILDLKPEGHQFKKAS